MKHYVFYSESSRPPKFWILPKLHELCKSFLRNPAETFEWKSFDLCAWASIFAPHGFLKFLIFCVTFWKFWNYETRCHTRRWDQHQYTSIFNIKYGKTRFWMAFFSVIITTACTNYSYKHYYVSKPVYKLCI